MFKTPDIRIHRVVEGYKIQIKCKETLFNEIIAENFQNIEKNIDI
jgi:hypothetical protein